jgi:subtilisin family serine protease
VSAMGRKGTFPAGTPEADDVAAPYGRDRQDFVAAFSNVGPEVDLIAPGVGVVSTVPGGHAVMSGTSMAAPAVTGAAARVLSGSPLLKGRRDAARSAAMAKAVLAAARTLGFKPVYEGRGMVR